MVFLEFTMLLELNSIQLDIPTILWFGTSESSLRLATREVLRAKWQDGRPAFKFRNTRHLLQNVEQFLWAVELPVRYIIPNGSRKPQAGQKTLVPEPSTRSRVSHVTMKPKRSLWIRRPGDATASS